MSVKIGFFILYYASSKIPINDLDFSGSPKVKYRRQIGRQANNSLYRYRYISLFITSEMLYQYGG